MTTDNPKPDPKTLPVIAHSDWAAAIEVNDQTLRCLRRACKPSPAPVLVSKRPSTDTNATKYFDTAEVLAFVRRVSPIHSANLEADLMARSFFVEDLTTPQTQAA